MRVPTGMPMEIPNAKKCPVCGASFEECVCTTDDRVNWMMGK